MTDLLVRSSVVPGWPPLWIPVAIVRDNGRACVCYAPYDDPSVNLDPWVPPDHCTCDLPPYTNRRSP